MSDEPQAIRHPKRGKAHRPVTQYDVLRGPIETAACRFGLRPYERVPLAQTAPADRCRTCWPTPKETP